MKTRMIERDLAWITKDTNIQVAAAYWGGSPWFWLRWLWLARCLSGLTANLLCGLTDGFYVLYLRSRVACQYCVEDVILVEGKNVQILHYIPTPLTKKKEQNFDHNEKKNYVNKLNNMVIKDSIPGKHNTGMSQRVSPSPVTPEEEPNDVSNEEKQRNTIGAMHLLIKNEMYKGNAEKKATKLYKEIKSKKEMPEVFRFTATPVVTPRKRKVHSKRSWNKRNRSTNAIEHLKFIVVPCVSPRKKLIYSACY